MSHEQRIERLGAALGDLEVDALVVASFANVRYLTGFDGSNAVLVVRPADAVFLTDFRYIERVAPLRRFLDVRQVDQDIFRLAGTQIAGLVAAGARVGFEADHLTVARHELLTEALKDVELVPITGAVETLRLVKDAGELELIRRAAAMTDVIYAALVEEGLVGRTEREVAWSIRGHAHDAGAEDLSFTPIVASGSTGALPHAELRDVAIENNTLVTVDLGCVVEGYCSDCTRTFATGLVPRTLDHAYQVCQAAQLAGLGAVRPGVTGAEVDAVVRGLIELAGLGERFGHGTGHGVGLEIHEGPRLARGSHATLEPGMVVTVEPGIYLPEVGGVRIEDLVVVTADGAERLTGYPKELITSI